MRRSSRSNKTNRSKNSKCEPSRTNPALWERVKRQVTKGSKGGPRDKWSARKAQIAVARYKSQGGRYSGGKKRCNSLSKWTREKWDYISPGSGSGRYLPERVRKILTSYEKRAENRRKGSRRGSRIPYSKSVSRKMRRTGIY